MPIAHYVMYWYCVVFSSYQYRHQTHQSVKSTASYFALWLARRPNRAKVLLLQRGNHNITKNAPYEQYGRPKGLVDSGSNTHQYSEYRGPNLDMKAFPLLSSLLTFEHSRIVLLPQSRWGVNWQCCGSRQVSCPANALWGTQTSAWNSAWFMFGIHKKEQSFSCEKWSLRDIERSKKILLGPSWQTLGALQLLRPLSLLQRQGVVAGPACRRSQRFQEGIALDSPGHFVGLFDWLFRYVHHVRPFRSAWQTLFWLAQHSAYTSFIKLVALKERFSSRKISACLPWSFARNSGCTLYFANRRRLKICWSYLKLLLYLAVCFFLPQDASAEWHVAGPSTTSQTAVLPGSKRCYPRWAAAFLRYPQLATQFLFYISVLIRRKFRS